MPTNTQQWITSAFIGLCLVTGHAAAQGKLPGDCFKLSARDHTDVVRSIEDNLALVVQEAKLQKLDVLYRSPDNIIGVLNAVAQFEFLDSPIRQKLKLSATCYAAVSAVELPIDTQIKLSQVATILDQSEDFERALMSLHENRMLHADDPVISEALQTTAMVLKDGQAGIYNTDHDVFRKLEQTSPKLLVTHKTAEEHVKDVFVADGKGALTGATGGCVAGMLAGGAGCGPGALAGGVAGAVGNSTLELIEKGWQYWFENSETR